MRSDCLESVSASDLVNLLDVEGALARAADVQSVDDDPPVEAAIRLHPLLDAIRVDWKSAGAEFTQAPVLSGPKQI